MGPTRDVKSKANRKVYLVSRLQALLQQRLLQWPRTAETEYLAQELLDYEIRVDENANDRYGAFRVGLHDDVVTAVGLAVIGADRWGGTIPMSVAGSVQGQSASDSLVDSVLRKIAAVRDAKKQAEAGGAIAPEGAEGLAELEHEQNVPRYQAALARMLGRLGDLNGGPSW